MRVEKLSQAAPVRLACLAFCLAFMLVAPAGFTLAENTAPVINVDSSGYAIGRYDPVAYFTQGRPVRGKTHLTARYKGAKYAFSSPANRALFNANPEKYAPQYGGYCAYGVVYGSKSAIDPQLWEIVGGRLYFLINAGTLSIWTRKKNSYIRTANKAWKLISKPN